MPVIQRPQGIDIDFPMVICTSFDDEMLLVILGRVKVNISVQTASLTVLS